MGGDAGRGAGGRVVGGGRSDAVLKNERKLRRDLRSGSPTAATRYAEVRTVSADRLCHQSAWSGMRLQVVERATATLLVGKTRANLSSPNGQGTLPRPRPRLGTRGPWRGSYNCGNHVRHPQRMVRKDNLADATHKDALGPIRDEVSASASCAVREASNKPQVETPYGPGRGRGVCVCPAAVLFWISMRQSHPLRADVGAPFESDARPSLENLLSIRILQAARSFATALCRRQDHRRRILRSRLAAWRIPIDNKLGMRSGVGGNGRWSQRSSRLGTA